MRKPDFCICENKDADQLCGNREADQRLCFRYTDSTVPLLPKSEISSLKPSSVAVQAHVISFCSQDQEVGLLTEITHLQEIMDSLCLQADNPESLPASSEQVIMDLKGIDTKAWSIQVGGGDLGGGGNRGWEIMDSLCLQADNPESLPASSEQVIMDLKGLDTKAWSIQVGGGDVGGVGV